ncbi:interferon-inducible GTPase-domain-containing protein [Fomitopsis betulina]|nr:interferon-inducible GTPase-domain-containing protein [Fomitopsis betulina]
MAVMTVLTVVSTTMGVASASRSEFLRVNPTMKAMEDRIAQLEEKLVHEREARRAADMLAGMVSLREFEATKRRLKYVEGRIHFAIAGSAGSGKSSLINAIRGMRTDDDGAALVGTSETTKSVQRYEHPDAAKNPFVWYDIPGAGTLNQPELEYFRQQGLYIFDAIIVIFDSRFTAADVAILKCCQEMKIPAYIVRSKALQHIRNILDDSAAVDEEEEDEEARAAHWAKASAKYVYDTQQTVKENLKAAGLDEQRVYIVDKKTMLQLVLGNQRPKQIVHERELLADVLKEMRERRLDGEVLS